MKFNSIINFFKTFPDEQSCIDHLTKIRWNGTVTSPFDKESKVYKCKNNRYKCKNTGKYFNCKTYTIFYNTPLGLHKWFLCIYVMISQGKGISSPQMAKIIEVTQPTAWYMMHRIRMALEQDSFELEGDVEVDETYIGGKNKNRHKDKKVEKCQGRSYKDKVPVFGMIQRDGKLIAMVVPKVDGETLKPIIRSYVKKGTVIHSDEWKAYNNLSRSYDHRRVDHGKGIYATKEGHTNTIEGAWSILKRKIFGIHHQVTHKQRYVNEFAFYYNNRDITNSEKLNLILKAA